jgi:hypothetical protein
VGAGRKLGSATKKTRAVANQLSENGLTPLEIMIDNMRHFMVQARQAEAAIGTVGADADEACERQLAAVKQAVDYRMMAQQCAQEAAPYIHPRLSAIGMEVKHERFDEMSDEELLAEIIRESGELGIDVLLRAGEGQARSIR